jgi:high-affinity iron transporter
MVDAILLILREVLEAALIITMLMVMSRKLSIEFTWIGPTLIFGGLSSGLLAHYAYEINAALGGTGQEWVNALLYLCVIMALIVIALIIVPLLFNLTMHVRYLSFMAAPPRLPRKLLLFSTVVAVALSLAREASEILIYLGGFLHQPEALQSAVIGAAIGTGIGVSLGIIIYYLLVFLSARKFLYLFFVLLVLLCGGLSMQIAQQLMQIGVLDSSASLWDASSIVNDHSWLGELLYALIGYESSPSVIQVIFYWLAVSPLLLALLWNWYQKYL